MLHVSQKTHPILIGVDTWVSSATKSATRTSIKSGHPCECRARRERVLCEERVENRRPRTFMRHRRPKRLIDVGALVMTQHEDDHHATLVRRIAPPAGWHVMAGVELPDDNGFPHGRAHPHRDLLGPAARTPLLRRASDDER